MFKLHGLTHFAYYNFVLSSEHVRNSPEVMKYGEKYIWSLFGKSGSFKHSVKINEQCLYIEQNHFQVNT